jgi:predicted ATPase/DNA-binding transcriptional regulator YiaG
MLEKRMASTPTTTSATAPKLLPQELFVMYRYRTGLTQTQLSQLLGLKSYKMVSNWELGLNLPSPLTFKKLIAIYLARGIFTKGQEREEACLLWNRVKEMYEMTSAGFRSFPVFDATWFDTFSQAPSQPPLPLTGALEPPSSPVTASSSILNPFQATSSPIEALPQLSPQSITTAPTPPPQPDGTASLISPPLTTTTITNNNSAPVATPPPHRLEEVASSPPTTSTPPDLSPAKIQPLPPLALSPQVGLPQPTSYLRSFKLIGREREVSQLCQLLRQPQLQLLTLTGPGGVGKTRLALEVISKLQPYFADGVKWVDLTPLRQASQVPFTLARAFALEAGSEEGLLKQLEDYLKAKSLLLVLDNFEQVLDGATFLAQLLAHAPGLKLLVTSREVLQLYGEQEYPLMPLALPVQTKIEEESLTQLEEYGAVELFVTRASLIQPGFGLTQENKLVVARLCRRLEGLPLALELAASQLRMFTTQSLLQLLENQPQLRVLKGGARDLPQRHQTLRETIQWSYHLLGEEEQRLFRGLGVFVGGFSLSAAVTLYQALVSGNAAAGLTPGAGQLGAKRKGAELEQVLELLLKLASKSLLRRSASDERFEMLESLREYALEELVRCGEMGLAQTAHWGYYLSLGKEWSERFVANLAQFDQEYANLLSSAPSSGLSRRERPTPDCNWQSSWGVTGKYEATCRRDGTTSAWPWP